MNLLRLQEELDGRADFRLLPLRPGAVLPSTAVCSIRGDYLPPVFVLGASPDFGLIEDLNIGSAHIVFEGESLLLSTWQNWFDCVWVKAAPLDLSTADIPDLYPGRGSPEAKRQWEAYLEACGRSLCQGALTGLGVTVTSSGEVTADNCSGDRVTLPCEQLEIPILDELALRIDSIYPKGCLVSFNKIARIKPLDAPMKTEWFGEVPRRRMGSVEKETRFRISVLSKAELTEIKNIRDQGTRLLERLSFSLADGVRWMPFSSIPSCSRNWTESTIRRQSD